MVNCQTIVPCSGERAGVTTDVVALLPSANARIEKPVPANLGGLVDVAQIDKHGGR
jgi:hypothetical protein